MQRFFLSLCLTFMSSLLFAQNEAIVSGKVLDKLTKEPIAYATVIIVEKSDTKTQAGTITEENGRFVIKGIPQGTYKLVASFLGYETKEEELIIGELNQILDLGKLQLEPSTTALNEVVIQAKRDAVSSSLDKKSFNIANNISQSGGSVMEAMRNLPGVTIDQEGKVLLRGSDQVTVLIDGKQSSLTGFGSQKGLDNIPASNIERIEIINNPSAKYDSRGMAGIVNIIYKKDKEMGWNGDIAFNFGLGELSNRKDNLSGIMSKYSWTPKYNPSISLNYRTKKINFFVQSDAIFRERVNTNEFTTRTYTDGTPAINSQFLENRNQQVFNFKTGLDWYIDDSNELTVFGLYEYEDHTDVGNVPYDYATGGRKRLWNWTEKEKTSNFNYSAIYKHKFDEPGHRIEASALIKGGMEDEPFYFTDTNAAGKTSADTTHVLCKEKTAILTLDYVRPLSSGRFEAGAKAQLRNNPIAYQILPGDNSILDPNLGTWSDYTEDIYAAYGNYIHESEKFDIEGGLRIENASIKYDIDPANNYYKSTGYNQLSLFPNVRLTYKMNDNNKISWFYNRRVDRPSEFELTPYPKFDDPEVLKTGNPYLRPQFTQTAEMAYKTNWKTGSFYISAYYKYITDLYTRVYTTTPENPELINSIPQNLGHGQNLGTEFILEQQLTSKWSANASFNWYQNTISAASGQVLYPQPQNFTIPKSRAYTWNLKLNTTIKLPHNFDIQGSFVYYAPDIIPQGRVEQRSSFDLGIRKKAFKGKAEFMLSATDIFNTFGIKQTINGSNFTMRSENYYETQVVKIGVKYKF